MTGTFLCTSAASFLGIDLKRAIDLDAVTIFQTISQITQLTEHADLVMPEIDFGTARQQSRLVNGVGDGAADWQRHGYAPALVRPGKHHLDLNISHAVCNHKHCGRVQ